MIAVSHGNLTAIFHKLLIKLRAGYAHSRKDTWCRAIEKLRPSTKHPKESRKFLGEQAVGGASSRERHHLSVAVAPNQELSFWHENDRKRDWVSMHQELGEIMGGKRRGELDPNRIHGATAEEREKSLEELIDQTPGPRREKFTLCRTIAKSGFQTEFDHISDTWGVERLNRVNNLEDLTAASREPPSEATGVDTEEHHAKKMMHLEQFVPMTSDELGEHDQNLGQLQVFADVGFTLEHAKSFLDIPLFQQFPRLRDMKHQVSLLDHQILGIAWMVKKLERAPRSVILADTMGLGKTIQSICTYLAVLRARLLCDPAKVEEKYGPDGICCIIVPSGLVNQWEADIRQILPDTIQVQVYGRDTKAKLSRSDPFFVSPGRKCERVLLCSLDTLVSRHSQTNWEKLSARDRISEVWDNAEVNINGLVWFRIIDEAHNLKAGEASPRFTMVQNLSTFLLCCIDRVADYQ
ncbi:hypothetical protein K402DRAFT_228474 [Aulographum hederae CBS 113979]|uniref:Helicase ATP-binding domain-containing protein n=1 Tax=Aulographum hederae CBS 113979 TaxID=1176131 RepID=A0A6G1HBK6_9PEZI|nr:hypothetical protein K402DRAFT_228474 [Aulographum hederae CBS 113979]